MTIYFTNVGIKRFLLKRLLEGALKYLNQPTKDLEMSISIVSPQQIQQLNKQYRNTDSVTDVLSFPTIDNVQRQVLDVSNFGADIVNPETGKINLGDVVICLDRAQEQAQAYGHSLKREIAFLSLHGLLHLLGYDHVKPEDEQQMVSLQKEILNRMHLNR